MRLRLLYFAAVRELRGLDEETIEVPDGLTVAGLRAHLEGVHAALQGRLHQVRWAVNEEFADDGAALSPGDEVAVIPPVAGGSGVRPSAERVAIFETPLSVDAALELVRHPGAGALTTFIGTVRDHHAGQAVSGLEYSAYASMALKEMAKIVEELEAANPKLRLAVHHRIGALDVGEVAVICAASSPHRAAAFEAGRQLIDLIKERVPIWKRERGEDGVSWVGWEDARVGPDGAPVA